MRLSLSALLFGFVAGSAFAAATQLVVTTSTDSGAGSLRQAILDAGVDPADTVISFDISGEAPHTITPLTALPEVPSHTTITAQDQLGPNREPTIVLDGSMLPPDTSGLVLTGVESSVLGLSIRRCREFGILLANGSSLEVRGCHVIASPEISRAGIAVANATNCTIGGTTLLDANLISGNFVGVHIAAASPNNRVLGNRIGTDATGLAAFPNVTGVMVDEFSPGCVIGGTDPRESNVISGNTSVGVHIDVETPNSGVRVEGNVIGLAAGGGAPVPNETGVLITAAPGCVVGGLNTRIASQTPGMGAGNAIAGNRLHGVSVKTSGHRIEGNFIGLRPSGTTLAGNGNSGVYIEGSDNTIGSDEPGRGNLIAGNVFGVQIQISAIGGNRLRGNRIGVDLFGDGFFPGHAFGVLMQDSSFNEIGGGSIAAGNVITGCRNAAVAILGTANNDLISHNAIFANATGIDLGNDGPTPNDPPPDADTGPNLLQNTPVSLEVFLNESPARFSGYLESAPLENFFIELFLTDSVDGTGRGQGKHFVEAFPVQTNAAGVASWERTVAGPLPDLPYVCATATGPAANTSEFSRAVLVEPRVPSAEEIADMLLGLIEPIGLHDRNQDKLNDAADVVTAVNASDE